MLKQNRKKFKATPEAKQPQQALPIQRVKAVARSQNNSRGLSDSVRVVFSEERNRNTELDDG